MQITVQTLSPELALLVKKNIENYLTKLEKDSDDRGIKRAASYAVNRVVIGRV